MELLYAVSCGEFVLYFPKYSIIFSLDKVLVQIFWNMLFPLILYIRLQVIKIKWSEISVKNKPHLKFSFMSLTNILSISVVLVFVILIGLEITFDISWYSFLVLCIIPQPDVKQQLGKGAGIGQVSKVVGNMWKKLPTDRRKVSYKLLTLRMFVY